MHPLAGALVAFLVFAGIIGVVVGSMWLGRYFIRKRMEEMRKLALSREFAFYPEGEPRLIEMADRFLLFAKGHSKEIRNLMHRRVEDVDLMLFDYVYVIGYGKQRQVHSLSVAGIRSSALKLPPLSLRSEGLLDKLSQLFGTQDIDFDSDPEFSSHWLLQGRDEAALRSLFTPELRKYFTGHPPINVEGDGDMLLCVSGRRSGEQVWSLLEQAQEVMGEMET